MKTKHAKIWFKIIGIIFALIVFLICMVTAYTAVFDIKEIPGLEKFDDFVEKILRLK